MITLTILLTAIFAGIIAFPIGAVLYWVITCWIGLLPTFTFWTWYGIAFIISFLAGLFMPSSKSSK